jgi:D-arabinose 1-dehydrogenase-like Zn-dependent alcohol dehydrogenase
MLIHHLQHFLENAKPRTLLAAAVTARHALTHDDPKRQELSWEPWSPPGPGEILVRVQACGLNDVAHAPSVGGMGAAGTVIAAGDRVTRFAVGDEVFGHFLADAWAWVQGPCARTSADGPHVERRPDGLDPLAAVALAEGGLTAKTILRAADLRPGQTAVVIGATSAAGTVLVPLLAEARAHVIEYATVDPVADAAESHPDADLLVDLFSFGEPYFITAVAPHGTIISAFPRPDGPGIPRIPISVEPGDLAALAQHAPDVRWPVYTAAQQTSTSNGE